MFFLSDKLSDYVMAFVEDSGLQPDCFYGVPEGATKLGIITQYKWAKILQIMDWEAISCRWEEESQKIMANQKIGFFLASQKVK